ncbi:hypothetical protein O9H85_08205 [Paenibacillus filicis]|uniref:Uncharacterized protein n=1 Tax=Paenibacillus gyeongsangnamensis TaxID=3388067 RepID=A0ABT4Q6B6_9BACL|nr:hypothetical protein [Paenibacillus filicis]MCZ8512415.1 hypothetical protein [Paenibacillus filicis]
MSAQQVDQYGQLIYSMQQSGSTLSSVVTLQNAANALGNGNPLNTSGYGVAELAVSGTFVGTIIFEGQGPDGNWYAVNAFQRGTNSASPTASATGLYEVNARGLTSVRARISSYTSGSITVIGVAQAYSMGNETNPSGGGGGSTTQSSPGYMRLEDGATQQLATISAFHNTDNQSFGGTTYGLMTGGVAQLLNTTGNLDRQRETGIDGIPALGIATGTQQLASSFSTTSTTSVTAGQTVSVTPAAMSGTVQGSAWSIQVGSVLVVDTGASKETVVVTAVTSNTFTAKFNNAHSGTWTISGFVYNQAKDATVTDGTTGTGLQASPAMLFNAQLNSGAGGWEKERSASGELDGASGTGTAVAAEYQFNGVNYDRSRNIQGKGVASGTISSGGGVGSTSITFSAAPTGLQPGSILVLTGGTTEVVYTSQSYVAGTNPVTIQTAIANSGHTGAQWDVYAVNGPGTSGFYPNGIGIAEEAVYDPSTGLYFLERAATADGVSASNIVMMAPSLWNGGSMDRWKGTNGAANVLTSTVPTIYHTTVSYSSLTAATTSYSFYFKSVLNYTARNRSITIVNNTNQNSGAVKVYTYDDAGTAVNYQDTSANLAVQMTAGIWTGGYLCTLKDGQGAGGIANCLYLNITTGSTAPTSGQFDIYVREVLV